MQSRWHDPLWRLLAALEEELGCNVGSNVYLTPAGSQGFAPHWCDVVPGAASMHCLSQPATWVAAVCTLQSIAVPCWTEACLVGNATEIVTGGLNMLNVLA